MLQDLFTRTIILLVAYAYPAYRCYKCIKKKNTQIEELTYWCKYWILVSLLTIFERIGDIFLSWFPLYRAIKIAVFFYLTYQKSQGINYIYSTILHPYMSKHRIDLSDLKTKAHSLLQCGLHYTLLIFKHLQQQRFDIGSKTNRSSKSKH